MFFLVSLLSSSHDNQFSLERPSCTIGVILPIFDVGNLLKKDTKTKAENH